VGTPEIAALSALAAAAALALVGAAVWWYSGLPHVQLRRQLKGQERMIRDFRKTLPSGPGDPPDKPPEK
jgi:hypothetical protein